MIRKLLRKIMGRKAAAIVDTVVVEAADAATKGKVREIERAVKRNR